MSNSGEYKWSYETFYEGKSDKELASIVKNGVKDFDGLTLIFWFSFTGTLIVSLILLFCFFYWGLWVLGLLFSIVSGFSLFFSFFLGLGLLENYRSSRKKLSIAKKVYNKRMSE